MDGFFNFDSVALFGVSPSLRNLGLGFIYNLQNLGYDGRIYALGTRPGDANGIPIHTSLDQIDDEIDLAVLLIPAPAVPEALVQCGKKGIRRVIIESSGFGEFTRGVNGADRALLDIAETYGMRFIGPNCTGTINVARGVILDFASMGQVPPPGPVGIISQSGGVTVWFANICANKGVGVTLAASVGNKLNVNEEDLLEYYLASPQVGTALLYLESIVDGPRLLALARHTEKPVVIFKSNTCEQAAGIANSHTTALLSDDRTVDQAFRQSGICRVHDTSELEVAIRAMQLKPCRGNRIFVISRSGGHAVMAADAANRNGFDLVEPPAEFFERLEKIIPTTRIIRQNPLDIGDVFEYHRLQSVVEAALELEGIDALVFLYMVTTREEPIFGDDFFDGIAEIAQKADIPVVLGLFRQNVAACSYIETVDGIVFENPDNAIQALTINRDYWQGKARAMRPLVPGSLAVDREAASRLLERRASGVLSPSDALAVLDRYGISTARWRAVASADVLSEAAGELHAPLVMKLDETAVTHKSDEGFVKLNLTTQGEMESARSDIQARYRELFADTVAAANLLLMEQAPQGLEVIVGAKRDATFGPVVMFGLGGVLTEIMDSVAMRICPVDKTMVLEMIGEVRGSVLLKGYRGTPPLDEGAVAETILRVASLMEHHPAIEDLDLNPVIVYPDGAIAVDARIMVSTVPRDVP